MSIYDSDKEQIEMIRDWWRENGRFTILSIVAALVLSAAWRYWQNVKAQDASTASIVYEQILNNESNHQYSQVEYDVTSLMVNHSRTPYAILAAFISAQNAINAHHLDAALEKFDWVIKHSKNADFKQIAKIRKARILLAMNKYDEGLDALADVKMETYLPLINEIRGDLFIAKGEKKLALAAYQNAFNALPKDAPNRNFLEMKYTKLIDNK